MLSQCYCYNNQLLRLLANNLTQDIKDNQKGFNPLITSMKGDVAAAKVNKASVDSLKLKYIELQ